MKKNLITKQLFSKKIIKANTNALEAYALYKKTTEILQKANSSSSSKLVFSSPTASTLNCEIKTNGIASTQKI